MTADEDEDTKLARMRAKFIERQDAQISKVKADLETWIDEHYQDHSLNVVVMSALLEVAFERFIDLHGEKDALELIESRFRRTAKITRPTLQ
jgi:molybdenum cofactor biosynthesis enzyme MoaA